MYADLTWHNSQIRTPLQHRMSLFTLVSIVALFVRYGIPQEVISDHGPMYFFTRVCEIKKVMHTFPRQAEKGVKSLLKATKDFYDSTTISLLLC